ncbi:MAG: hypothetical protein NDI73_01555 [Desulfuromonadales bacterium]|nr:hypothetical protein [Desulfuromonadales bacterium]
MNNSANEIERVVRGYEINGDKFLTEIRLAKISLEELRKIFNITSDDNVLDCYKIGENEYCELRDYIEGDLDFEYAEYFLEVK